MTEPGPAQWARYVAIGDSSTEGLDDPDGTGGYRGWADRLAQHLADAQGTVAYANLAVRGRRTGQVRDEQLASALAMRPELCTVFTGTNDVVARRFDLRQLERDISAIHDALRGAGTTLLTFTLPDLAPVLPPARLVTPRVMALNAVLRSVSARSGAICVDLAAHAVASDPRLWSEDRLHANALGHARIAAALAHALGVAGADSHWASPFPVPWRPTVAERVVAGMSWSRRHFLPWLLRHARGRSSGDGRSAKRPALEVITRA